MNNLLLQIFILYFSLSMHESAHAYFAYLAGDRNDYIKQRISLNPLVHIDPIGTLLIPLIGILFSPGFAIFGWGKPVIINPYYFKNRRLGEFLCSLAGPLANIILIIVSIIFARIIIYFFGYSLQLPLLVIKQFIKLNTILSIFNLIPIPPLDGSGILKFFLPNEISIHYERLQVFGIIILLIIINTKLFNLIITLPIIIFLSLAKLL